MPAFSASFLRVFGGLSPFVGHDHDEALQLSVFADLRIDLLDQTGQGLGGLAGEDADHRSGTVPSAITEGRALVRAGDVVYVEWVDRFTGLQAGLDGISREAGPHNDDGDHHGGDAHVRTGIASASPWDGPDRSPPTLVSAAWATCQEGRFSPIEFPRRRHRTLQDRCWVFARPHVPLHHHARQPPQGLPLPGPGNRPPVDGPAQSRVRVDPR